MTELTAEERTVAQIYLDHQDGWADEGDDLNTIHHDLQDACIDFAREVLAALDLPGRDARIRAQVAEQIAVQLEADAADEALRPVRGDASRLIETWLREAALVARARATTEEPT